MRLHATCPCGATFDADDPRGTYINPGGAPDEKGRIHAVQVQFDRWHDDHKHHQRSEMDKFFNGR